MDNPTPSESAAPTAAPRVSIVICAFNAGDYLRASVQSALAQTWQNLEVLLVDDGSTDGSVEALADIADPRLRILRQANTGKPGAMNRALAELTGDFYAIQDADDLSYPERIERQVECLLAHPTVAGAFCGYDLLIGDRRLAPHSRGRSVEDCQRDIAEFRMPGHDPTAMYRMAMVADFRYDPELPIGEGLDYILRVGEQYPLMVCPGTLYSYRVNLDGLTKKDPRDRIGWVQRALRRACERRGVSPANGPPVLGWSPDRPLQAPDRDNNIAAEFMDAVVDLRRAGRWGEALSNGLYCARLHPFQLHYLKALVYALVPLWTLRRLRRAGS